uniref:Multidrug resistance protein 1 n=1 Tax=Ascaris suum TaxID=6253 RepID=F1LCE7_ASCSU
MMLSNEITPFDYLRVVLLTQFGANFISQLIASVSDLTKARVAAENILGVINESAVDMNNLSDEGLRPKINGRLMLKNVEFRYPSRPILPVLRNLTFKVRPGESVAIVGPSGSGKSSVFALLQRMYTPTSGEVLIDNYNVKSINPAYLRRVVVSVGQEPTLFSFTLRENIGYGLPEDEATEEKIIKAAKIANIHDFIVSLPQGYDTEVGEFGAQLSGGQKQRIAIARAMIREPRILLLDEATAALDTASEKAVQAALESASKNCTSIHIAHRLSSIRTVDKIIVLVDGEIAEQGTHQELMEEKGLYYEMNQSEI